MKYFALVGLSILAASAASAQSPARDPCQSGGSEAECRLAVTAERLIQSEMQLLASDARARQFQSELAAIKAAAKPKE